MEGSFGDPFCHHLLASCFVISSMFVGPRLLAKLSFRLETRQDLLPLFGGGSAAQTLNKGLGFPMDSWISLHCDFVHEQSPIPTHNPFCQKKWVKIFSHKKTENSQSSSPAAQHCRAARHNISSWSHLPEALVQGPTFDRQL